MERMWLSALHVPLTCVLAITSLPMFGRTSGSSDETSMWVSWQTSVHLLAWGVRIGPSSSESLSQDQGNGRKRRRRRRLRVVDTLSCAVSCNGSSSRTKTRRSAWTPHQPARHATHNDCPCLLHKTSAGYGHPSRGRHGRKFCQLGGTIGHRGCHLQNLVPCPKFEDIPEIGVSVLTSL